MWALQGMSCVLLPAGPCHPERVEALPGAGQGREPVWPREARQFLLLDVMLMPRRFHMGVVQLPDASARDRAAGGFARNRGNGTEHAD